MLIDISIKDPTNTRHECSKTFTSRTQQIHDMNAQRHFNQGPDTKKHKCSVTFPSRTRYTTWMLSDISITDPTIHDMNAQWHFNQGPRQSMTRPHRDRTWMRQIWVWTSPSLTRPDVTWKCPSLTFMSVTGHGCDMTQPDKDPTLGDRTWMGHDWIRQGTNTRRQDMNGTWLNPTRTRP